MNGGFYITQCPQNSTLPGKRGLKSEWCILQSQCPLHYLITIVTSAPPRCPLLSGVLAMNYYIIYQCLSLPSYLSLRTQINSVSTAVKLIFFSNPAPAAPAIVCPTSVIEEVVERDTQTRTLEFNDVSKRISGKYATLKSPDDKDITITHQPSSVQISKSMIGKYTSVIATGVRKVGAQEVKSQCQFYVTVKGKPTPSSLV